MSVVAGIPPSARMVPISFTRCSVAITMALLITTSAMPRKITTAKRRTPRMRVRNSPTVPAACCQSTTLSRSPEQLRLGLLAAHLPRAHPRLEPPDLVRLLARQVAVEVAEAHEVHHAHHPRDAGALDPLELQEPVDLHVDGAKVAALRRRLHRDRVAHVDLVEADPRGDDLVEDPVLRLEVLVGGLEEPDEERLEIRTRGGAAVRIWGPLGGEIRTRGG